MRIQAVPGNVLIHAAEILPVVANGKMSLKPRCAAAQAT
jgi:hypothetical protein